MNHGSTRTVLLVLGGLVLVAAAAAALFFQPEESRTARGSSDSAPPAAPDAPESTASDVATIQASGGATEGRLEIAPVATPVSVGPPKGDEAFERALSGLVGRVVEPDGTPAPGVSVDLLGGVLEFMTSDFERALFDPSALQIQVEQGHATTGPDGRFRIGRVDPRLWYALGLNLGRGRPQIRLLDRSPNPAQTVDLGDLVLAPRLALSGRIVDDRGRAVAGARVRATAIPTVAFQFGAKQVVPGCAIRFPARGAGLGPFWELPAWTTPLFEKLPMVDARSDAEGRFRIEGAPGGALTLLVDGAGLPPHHQGPIPPPAGDVKDLGDVVVPRGDDVDIQVVDLHGAPLGGAEVRLGLPSPLQKSFVFFRPPERSDAKGQHVEHGVIGDRAVVAARATGSADWVVSDELELTGDPLVVRVPAPRAALVRVRDAAGQPLDATIAVHRSLSFLDGVTAVSTPLAVAVERPEPGAHRLRGLLPGSYDVFALVEGKSFGAAALEIPETGEPLETLIECKATRTVEAIVMAGDRGVPLEGARVFAASERGMNREGLRALASARTDARGRAAVRAPGEDNVSLIGSHPAYALARARIDPAIPGATVLTLTKGGTLEGRVTKSGAPPPKAQMILAGSVGMDSIEPPRMRITDADGTFRFTHLAPGQYRVECTDRVFDGELTGGLMGLFEMRGAGEGRNESVMLEDGGVARVDFDLDRTGRLPTAEDGRVSGSVRLNGRVMERGQVQASGAEWRQARIQDDGRFDFGALKQGSYQLTIVDLSNDRWSTLGSRQVELRAGAHEVIDFDVAMGGPIVGRVFDASTLAPIAGASVSVQSSAEREPGATMIGGYSAATTDETGRFSIDLVAAGPYELRAEADGYAGSGGMKVDVALGAVIPPVEVRLARGVPVAGRVEHGTTGKPRWGGLGFSGKDQGGTWAWVNLDLAKMSFETRELAPGSYTVYLNLSFPRGEGFQEPVGFQPIQVEIPAGGDEGLVLKFEPIKAAKPAKH